MMSDNLKQAHHYKKLLSEVKNVLTYPSIGPMNRKVAEGLKNTFYGKALHYWNEAQKDSN
jgi:hypothetical protein